MSEQVRGYVRKINEKKGTGKRGPWTAYSVKLTNEDGSAERDGWYSNGFDTPNFAEGDYIEASVEKKGDYLNLKDAKKIAAPAKQQAASGGGSKMPATDKDNRIAYQAARNAAIELVDVMIRNGALPLPKKAPDQYALIKAAVDKETVQFYHDTATMRLLETVADGGALEEPPAELLATTSAEDDD